MNFERAKSIILIILIVISSYLTWSIWTYEPEYEKIDQEYINIKSDEQTMSDVIKPNSILIHRYNQHFQTSDHVDIEKAEEQMAKWKLFNLTWHSPQLTREKFEEVIHADGSVEIIFSDDIPLTLYKTALQIGDKEVPAFSFDRIIYKQKDIHAQKATIYFASSENFKLLEASVETRKLKDFNSIFYQNASSYPEYELYLVNKQHQVFVPKHQVTVNLYKYYTMGYLDKDNFKNALFPDPMNVRHETVIRGEEYTDSTRLMSVNKDTYTISFINPSQKSTVPSSSRDLLAKSIEFINNHAGWNGSNYRFDRMNETYQSVSFRLYNDSHPVFNQLGMSEIKEIWGDEQIYSYERPYFTLDYELPSETKEVLMPSGSDVMDQLKLKPNFDYVNVEDLTIGYKLSISPLDTNLILLEPTWYYRSGGDWLTVPFDESGGKINGLE